MQIEYQMGLWPFREIACRSIGLEAQPMRAVYDRLHFRMHVVDLHGDRVNSYDLTSFEFIIASHMVTAWTQMILRHLFS